MMGWMHDRPSVQSVSPGATRPLWSVMIPTYNCAEFLRQTLRSVLSQDPGRERMQIEVVDDCSTADDPRAVVEEIGRGRVEFYRQPRNLGHVGNFNTCLRRSRGKLIHLLHGDDLVLDGFYRRMCRPFEEEPEIGAAFCRHGLIDEAGEWRYLFPLEQPERGILPGWLELIAVKQRIVPPAIVVRREVFERVGGFDPRIRCYGEDWEMWVRIAAAVPVWYEPRPLAAYRSRSASLTGQSVRTGENLRDAERAIGIFAAHLPASRAPDLVLQARRWVAVQAIRDARRVFSVGDFPAVLAQLRGALRIDPSWNVVREVGWLSFWAARRMARAAGRAGKRALRGA